MKKIRDTNVEIIRIIAILGVIILHYNNASMGKALLYTQNHFIKNNLLIISECLCICSVNLFVLLNGYFMFKKQTRVISKPIKLIFEVIFFSLVFYGINILLKNDSFSFLSLMYHCLPANYFVILYVTLYFISPYINIVLMHLNEKEIKKMLVIILMLFSVYPSFLELFNEITNTQILGLSTIGMYGSQYGYTIVNFVLLYIIGAYLNILNDKYPNKMKCLFIYLLSAMCIFFWYKLGLFLGKDTSKSALSYFNPFCILSAVSVFMLFKQIKMKNNVVLNYFAKASFIVFLVHTYFLNYAHIDSIVDKSSLSMMFHLVCTAILIYISGVFVYTIYIYGTKIILTFFKYLKNRVICKF